MFINQCIRARKRVILCQQTNGDFRFFIFCLKPDNRI